MTSAQADNIATVRRYFDACNSGSVDDLAGTLAPDVVHFFLPSELKPIRGAEQLARHWAKFKRALDPIWAIDRIIASGDDAVCEWSCIWTPKGSGRRILMRGTDWYAMQGGRIAEVRAYVIHSDTADVELATFPYRERGYLVRSC